MPVDVFDGLPAETTCFELGLAQANACCQMAWLGAEKNEQWLEHADDADRSGLQGIELTVHHLVRAHDTVQRSASKCGSCLAF